MDGMVEVDSGDISVVVVIVVVIIDEGGDDDDGEGPVEIEKGEEFREEVREEEEGIGRVGTLAIADEGEDKGDVEGDVITE